MLEFFTLYHRWYHRPHYSALPHRPSSPSVPETVCLGVQLNGEVELLKHEWTCTWVGALTKWASRTDLQCVTSMNACILFYGMSYMLPESVFFPDNWHQQVILYSVRTFAFFMLRRSIYRYFCKLNSFYLVDRHRYASRGRSLYSLMSCLPFIYFNKKFIKIVIIVLRSVISRMYWYLLLLEVALHHPILDDNSNYSCLLIFTMRHAT